MAAASLEEAVAQALAYLGSLTPSALVELGEVYADDVAFTDPFQSVQGLDAVRAIYAHMFEALEDPRFVVDECVRQGTVAYVHWVFHFARAGHAMQIHGVSRLAWAQQADGCWRIVTHRDDWDAAHQLYEKLPVLGGILRLLKRRLATPQPGEHKR